MTNKMANDEKRLRKTYYVLAGTFATILFAVELILTHGSMVTGYTIG